MIVRKREKFVSFFPSQRRANVITTNIVSFINDVIQKNLKLVDAWRNLEKETCTIKFSLGSLTMFHN